MGAHFCLSPFSFEGKTPLSSITPLYPSSLPFIHHYSPLSIIIPLFHDCPQEGILPRDHLPSVYPTHSAIRLEPWNRGAVPPASPPPAPLPFNSTAKPPLTPMGARCRARPRCADSRRQGAVAAFPRQLAPGRGGGEKMGVA